MMKKFLIVGLCITIPILGFLLLISFRAPKAPIDFIGIARVALSEAGKQGAEKYASVEYKIAAASWDSLLSEWRSQNEIIFVKRNYSRLIQLADSVINFSELAGENARKSRHDIQTAVDIDLDILKATIVRIDSIYQKIPLSAKVYRDIASSKIVYAEAELANDRMEFHEAAKMLSECHLLLNSAEKYIDETLHGYFESYEQWVKWKEETITWSRRNHQVAILVDKIAHKCYIINNGKIVQEFDAEFGPNWIGTKNHKGDKATPEGKYFISKKLDTKQTKYYKALLINYPNADDKKRYEKAVREGAIKAGTGIGNLIEIHGTGGQGVNWTDGCVALDNIDMDKVFRLASVNTPVTIIGSMKPLDAIYKKD
jgi:hypothetical protein